MEERNQFVMHQEPHLRSVGKFKVGTTLELDRVTEESLTELLNQAPLSVGELSRANVLPGHAGHSNVLEGRGHVILGTLPQYGPVIVKCYHRGGLFQCLVRDRYLKAGKTRGQREYEMLAMAQSLGVHVPRPIAFAFTGFPFYRAWLVMAEIIGKRSLALLCREDEDLCRALLPEFIRQLHLLIQGRILHVDLHPGNVVLDREGRLYVLDFDKAEQVRWSRRALRDYYLRRWRRAVIKHALPDFLSEAVCLGLRQNVEEGR